MAFAPLPTLRVCAGSITGLMELVISLAWKHRRGAVGSVACQIRSEV
jgi:hypothetical protein